jgi:predicted transcriptional regulator
VACFVARLFVPLMDCEKIRFEKLKKKRNATAEIIFMVLEFKGEYDKDKIFAKVNICF